MFDDPLSPGFKEALVDWFAGAELAEFLDIPIEEIIEAFPDRILAAEKELRAEMRMDDAESDEDD